MKRLLLCLLVFVTAFSMLAIVLTVAASPVQEQQIQEGPFQEPDDAPEDAASPLVSSSDVYSNVYLVDQLGGEAWAVAISGTYAYVGFGPRLIVLDVSEPATPTVRGRTEPFPGLIPDVAVAGDYAYVANRSTGLRVVDISDPANPVEVGFCDTGFNAWGVAVAGDYAYVANSVAGLRVVDVSDPSNPVEVGFDDNLGNANDVSVVGNIAYVQNTRICFFFNQNNTPLSKLFVSSGNYVQITVWKCQANIIKIHCTQPCDNFVKSVEIIDAWAYSVKPAMDILRPFFFVQEFHPLVKIHDRKFPTKR